jgi:hypothetical protein
MDLTNMTFNTLRSRRFPILASVLIACAVNVAAPSIAADKPVPDTLDRYANKLPITLETAGQGMYRLRVPFAFARAPERTSATTNVTPLKIFPVQAEAASSSGATSVNLKINADGTLISVNAPAAVDANAPPVVGYIVDASALAAKKESVSRLKFDWAASEQSQAATVRVEESDDLTNWRMLTRGHLANMKFNGEALTQTHIEFPASTKKYFRVMWEGSNRASTKAFELTGIASEATTTAVLRDSEAFNVTGRAGKEPGQYEFDLGAKVTPDRVRLLLPELNSIAPTILHTRTLATERRAGGRIERAPVWQPVGNATFYRVMRDDVEFVSPATRVSTSQMGATEWMAQIENRGGGIGSGMPKLQVFWQPVEIVFTARGEPPFTLAFGRNDAANDASFNVVELLPGYKQGDEFKLPVASLSTAMPKTGGSTTLSATTPGTSAIAPPAPPPPASDTKKYILWAILILGVGLMGWMAIRLGKSTPESADAEKKDA